PVVMKLWTTSYGLVTAGWAFLVFLFLFLGVDVWSCRQWSFSFSGIGAHAIFFLMFRSLIPLCSIVGGFTPCIARLLPRSEVLVQEVAVLAVEWLILYWMYRRRIFIKA